MKNKNEQVVMRTLRPGEIPPDPVVPGTGWFAKICNFLVDFSGAANHRPNPLNHPSNFEWVPVGKDPMGQTIFEHRRRIG